MTRTECVTDNIELTSRLEQAQDGLPRRVESWGFNSTHIHGTQVPVEEPSTASQTDSRIAAFLVDHVASATCREAATDRLQFPLKPRGMLRARGGKCAIKVQPPAGATIRLRVAFCPVPAFH